MASSFTIFYYNSSLNTVNTKILAMCNNKDNALDMIYDKFCNFGRYINGTIVCHSRHENFPCILWINEYILNDECEYDKSYIQPNGSFDVSLFVEQLNDDNTGNE